MHACFLLQRGLKTLPLRVRQQSANALALAQVLEKQPQAGCDILLLFRDDVLILTLQPTTALSRLQHDLSSNAMQGLPYMADTLHGLAQH